VNLAIFDIDGTLTLSDRVGRRCFVEAFRLEFGFSGVSLDWSDDGHSTDSGITRQVFRERRRSEPTPEEMLRHKRRYRELLSAAVTADPSAYRAVAGAAAALDRLAGREDWRLAIGSGNWRETGLLKLATASVPARHLPGAFADDAIEREQIVRLAIARACEHTGVGRFERIVYVGDAPWDARAAAAAEVAFVGIATGERAARLQAVGASHTVDDFRDFDALLDTLHSADRPNADDR